MNKQRGIGLIPTILACLAISLLVVSSSTAKTFYVDATSGKDCNTGTSAEDPWKTITRVNQEKLQPGDRVLFKRGEIWRKTLNIRHDGTAGNPIIYGAYGSGRKPIITGAELALHWSKANRADNIWETEYQSQGRVVTFDGVLGKEESSAAQLNQEFEYLWRSGKLLVFSTSNPSDVYQQPGIEVSHRNVAISGLDSRYYVIDGLDIRGANGDENQGGGIHFFGDHVTIKNCNLSLNFYAGILAGDAADDGTISNCDVHHNIDNGIALGKGSDWVIEDCKVYTNGSGPRVRSGILFDTSNITVSRCIVYDNGNGSTDLGLTHGIYVNPTARNVIIEDCTIYDHRNGNGINYDADSGEIRRNYIYDNRISGIHLENQSSGGWVTIYNNIIHGNNCGIMLFDWRWHKDMKVRIYNNTLYENNSLLSIPGIVDQKPYELCIRSNIKELIIKNNIFYKTTRYAAIHAVGQDNMISDHNSLYKSSGANDSEFCFYDGRARTFPEWQSATKGDANSLTADPLFVSAVKDNPEDFRLHCDSPGKDAGSADVADFVTSDFAGQSFDGKDIGAYRVDCDPEESIAEITGKISYNSTGAAVPNTTLTLSEDASDNKHTDESGVYAFDQLVTGLNYRITPSKTADFSSLNTISCFDAALIARIAAGLERVSPGDSISADVDENGQIQTFDAVLTCHFALGLASISENDRTGQWRFAPEYRSYATLNSNQKEQDFTAMLLGDADGSWSPASVQANKSTAFSDKITFSHHGWSDDEKLLTATLHFKGGVEAFSFEIPVYFDSEQLSYREATASLDGWQLLANDSEQGVLRLGMYATKGINQPSDFVTISWDKAAQASTVHLTLQNALVNDQPQASQQLMSDLPSSIPRTFQVFQNHPNPFNPETRIKFDIPPIEHQNLHVRFAIYNTIGQLVRLLIDEHRRPGSHEVRWDARNESGIRVPSGVYFYSVTVDKFYATKKMLLIR